MITNNLLRNTVINFPDTLAFWKRRASINEGQPGILNIHLKRSRRPNVLLFKLKICSKILKPSPPTPVPPVRQFKSRRGLKGGRTKCQPDKMPTGQNANLGWHFVRDFFSMVGILSGPTFWLAFCPDHLNMSWHPPPQHQRVGTRVYVDDDNDDDYEYKKFHFTLSPSTFAFSPRCIQFRWLDL